MTADSILTAEKIDMARITLRDADLLHRFEVMAAEAELDAMVMLYLMQTRRRWGYANRHNDLARIGSLFDPFTGNSDGS